MSQLAKFIRDLQGQEFLILDTETTGLDRAEIVEICILSSRGQVLLDTLVKPKMPIPLDATKIHGINDASVKDAPNWLELQEKVADILKSERVVIYNAVYDRKMLHQTAERWELPHYDYKAYSDFYCAMEAYAEFYGDFNRYRGSFTWKKLSDAYQYIGGQRGDAHRAKADCKMTLAITQYLLALNPDLIEENYNRLMNYDGDSGGNV